MSKQSHLVYFSPVPWDSFEQRPHHFVKWYQNRFNSSVTWVNPYPTRLPHFDDFIKIFSTKRTKKNNIPKNIKIYNPRCLPIEPLKIRFLNQYFFRKIISEIEDENRSKKIVIVVGKPSQLALKVLKKFPQVDTFYDAMDDFPHFSKGLSRKSVSMTEIEVAKEVKHIIVSSSELKKKFDSFNQKVTLVRNACASEQFSNPSEKERVSDSLVFGYVGTVAGWFDWEFVRRIALARPTDTIKIIGPIHIRKVPTMPSNVQFIGECNLAQAIKHIESFDVGIIPFLSNPLTASVDPIKYYEYRCAGLPVLSTPFGEMPKHESSELFLVKTEDLTEHKIADCASCRQTTSEIINFRKSNSWSSRFDQFFPFSNLI